MHDLMDHPSVVIFDFFRSNLDIMRLTIPSFETMACSFHTYFLNFIKRLLKNDELVVKKKKNDELVNQIFFLNLYILAQKTIFFHLHWGNSDVPV